MVSTEELIKIVSSQKEDLQKKDLGTERKILKTINLNVSPASILTGIRRCGKSTLLRQLMKKIKNFNYVNFEDPRLVDFKISDFERLNEAFQEINGPCEYYFFDEIQNLPGWERIVRGLLDTNKKCIITGSNASLLSRELGTKLTGRHLNYELFPFSYQEMLDMTNNKPSLESFKLYL
jgi:predicted AAA+ superfamily ATPase